MENKEEDVAKITLNIESATQGHETVSLTKAHAIARIKQETEERGKWLYCDGEYTQVNVSTEEGLARLGEILSQAKDITLAGTLLGGSVLV